MTIQEYEKKALSTSKYDTEKDMFFANVYGIIAEAGEVAGKIEKKYRKQENPYPGIGPNPEAKELIKELGDILWHLTGAVNALGYSLEGCMILNIKKLRDRERRGVIIGHGDNR